MSKTSSAIFLDQLRRWGRRNGARTWQALAALIKVDRVTLSRWRKSGIPEARLESLRAEFPGVLTIARTSRVMRENSRGALWPLVELFATLQDKRVASSLQASDSGCELAFSSRLGPARLRVRGDAYELELISLAAPAQRLAAGPVDDSFRPRCFRYARALLPR